MNRAHPAPPEPKPPRALAAVVFFTALVTLAVEVFYTRLFSALFWKNTALAILSLAMLGIGASGVLVYLRPRWFTAERMSSQLAWLCSAFGASIVVSYVAIITLAARSYSALEQLGTYVALVAAALVPFFFGGLVLSVVFTHRAAHIARLYRIDLVGAAAGAVLALPLLQALGGPLIVPVLAALATAAGAAYAWHARHGAATMAALLLLVGLAGLGLAQARAGVLSVTHSHGQRERGVEIERWDALARLTVQAADRNTKWINIDSQVATPVLRRQGDANLSYLDHNVLQLAYRVRAYDRVLIIGPGGGSDVLAALRAGNRDVTGVEVNRSTVRLMKHELSDYSGGLYHQPEVSIHVADGRAWVAASAAKVDLIQATFVDTFTATGTGHTLSENYLYTIEGLHDFLDHLNDGGVLSLSRWGGEAYSFAETHRAVVLAIHALEERGAANPEHHVVVVQGAPPGELVRGGGYQRPGHLAESMSTLLVKDIPFDAAELDALERSVRASRFRTLWMGRRGGPDEVIADLFSTNDRPRLYREYLERTGLDIGPVTDDRPFFFDMIDPVRSLFRTERPEWGKHIYYFARAVDVRMLHQLFGATVLVAGAVLLVPLVARFRDLRGVRRPASTLGYFVCLGLGFIGIEITLMQRFAMFLEHPVYSLVVLLASILLFGGIGSAATEKHAAAWRTRAPAVALALVGVLVVYGLAIAPVTRALVGLPLVVKFVIASGAAAAPAFLMGMMFPFGITAVRDRAAQLVPWVWGLNSAFSVVGAVACLYLAMSFGHTVTWFVFVATYGLAWVSLRRMATLDGGP